MFTLLPALTSQRCDCLRDLWLRHAELSVVSEPFRGAAPELATIEEEIDFLEMLVLTPTRSQPAPELLVVLGRPHPAPDPLRVLDFNPRAREARHEWIAFRDGTRAVLRLRVWSDLDAHVDLTTVARRGPCDPRLASSWRHEMAVLATSQRILGIKVTERVDWGTRRNATAS